MVIVTLVSSNVFAQTAGEFQWPFNKDGQVWNPPCSEGLGYKNAPDQYHTEVNYTFNGYHVGEDWNGVCGGNTDLNGDLYAIADGIVDEVGEDSSRGKWLSIIYTLPNGKQVKSVYFHLNDISVSVTNPVYRNSTVIAKIGNTGTILAHLHWGMLTDMNAPIVGYNQLSVTDALKYTPPALFVDDRNNPNTPIALVSGAWNYFYADDNAPSSTTYIEYGGNKYTLQQAAASNIIHEVMEWWDGAAWQQYSSLDKVFFGKYVWHDIWALVPNVNLIITIPGNGFLADRARSDMVYTASQDSLSRFQDVLSESYQENLSWDPSWELRQMAFTVNQTYGWIYQITNISNRLLRYTAYYDPDTGVWTGWTAVDRNKLY